MYLVSKVVPMVITTGKKDYIIDLN